ncbi:MAG: 4-(cytidine 5'-diphospho)-2-C-methyl-D-erythritol kinase [Phycisphaerales bacterium]|nr:4-(cytidine 5'-diphospho)-2-C-methyl-D-erythritol kinase [Phycisphaerales bacterium]
MSRCLHIKAPAKINAALSVGPPGADGLHPICSWMITVDLCDEMTLTPLEPDRLSRYAILWHDEARVRQEIDWSITSDLAVKAHLALEAWTKRRLPIQMKLEKRIPLGGGLGGGSSDAAAMLRGCNALFDLSLSDRILEGIAASIGSDVPFLVRGGSAIVEGTGEMVEYHESMPALHAVLIFPAVACHTGRVYQQFDAGGGSALDPAAVRALAEEPIDGDRLFNDLAEPAMTIAPELQSYREDIAKQVSAPVHVSGSGSTLFVMARNEMESEAMARAIEAETGLAALVVSAAAPEVGIVDRFAAESDGR